MIGRDPVPSAEWASPKKKARPFPSGHFRSRFPLGPIFRRIEGVALTDGNSTGKVAPEGSNLSSMGPKSEVHRGGSFPADSDMLLLCSKRRCPGLERVIARRHVLYGKVAIRAGD